MATDDGPLVAADESFGHQIVETHAPTPTARGPRRCARWPPRGTVRCTHLDGEHLAACTDPTTARRIHQIRDAVMRVDDPIGGGRGWCNLHTAIVGAWPDEGLDEESSFV
jgi:hypothetical protein